MNILYISDTLGNIGGAAKSGREVLQNLLSSDYDVDVISYDRHKKILKVMNGNTTGLHNWIEAPRENKLSAKMNVRLPRNIVKWFLWHWWNYLRRDYVNKISSLNPNIVFVNSIGSHRLFEACNFKKRPRSIMIFRASPSHFTIPDNTSQSLEEAINILDKYDEIVFVSSIVRDKWLSFDRLANKKTYYIPNSCDEKEISKIKVHTKFEVRNKIGIPENEFAVVCVATLQYHKGLDILVDNIHEMIKNIPDLRLYLIGKPIYPWGTNLVKQIKSMKLEKKLTVLGHHSDVLNFIYGADLLVLPSKVEAMPRVIIESMALGTPIIATDVDGIPELIKHSISGLLFSPGDGNELLRCLKKLYEKDKERENYAKMGNKIYWSNFTRDLQTKRYMQLINNQLL